MTTATPTAARYLLAMSYALASGPTEEAVDEAASLLDQQIEVRSALSPVVVAKFLSSRDTPHAEGSSARPARPCKTPAPTPGSR